VSARIYIEGGGDSKELHIRCREAFHQLFRSCGFSGRMPRFVACGSRNNAYEGFKTAHASADGFVALLIDSEDPIADIEKTWTHLQKRDGWAKPAGADDEQVLLMTTSMETWIVTDRAALRTHFGSRLQESALPALNNIEQRDRKAVFDALQHATRDCKIQYEKGKCSFALVTILSPQALRSLSNFVRFERVLNKKL